MYIFMNEIQLTQTFHFSDFIRQMVRRRFRLLNNDFNELFCSNNSKLSDFTDFKITPYFFFAWRNCSQ